MEYKLYVLLSPKWPNLKKKIKKNLNMLISMSHLPNGGTVCVHCCCFVYF